MTYKNTQNKLKKLSKHMGDLAHEALVHKGKTYLRNSDNEVWLRGADGGCGEWQGVYLPAEDRIDDSVPEPVFDDEE